MEFWAHTPRKGSDEPHRLKDHLLAVAGLAREFGSRFEAGDLAYLLGLFHDLGKASPEFQGYLREAYAASQAGRSGPRRGTVDHSSAGAVLARALYEDIPGLEPSGGKGGELAWAVAAHHAGLSSLEGLEQRLLRKQEDPSVRAALDFAEAHMPDLLEVLESTPELPDLSNCRTREFFIRMLLSALVDADHLDTEAHRSPEQHRRRRRVYASINKLWADLETNQQSKMANAEPTPLNRARREVYEAALQKALEAPGFFRLTVPTGGGKTRTSLGFALRHAKEHGQERVIYAIPYTSITTQTAGEFSNILGPANVLEHHSAYDPLDDETEQWAKLAAENWEAPVVVTTTVQLFESLFSNRPSKVRKLHRLARSVIVLDEVQTLPAPLLDPILDVLRELVYFYEASVVLCTATQPALDESPQFRGLPDVREIAPEPERYFRELERVEYHLELSQPWSWSRLADELKQHPQVLCIVNTKKQARELFQQLGDPKAFHLSTNLTGLHRRWVLHQIRQRLKEKHPCRVIATQLVEAGVDLDFPWVFRAVGPLDSIVQAAGRCNREGQLPHKGQMMVFRPEDSGLPQGVYKSATLLAQNLLHAGVDLNDPKLFKAYFRELYTRLVSTDAQEIQTLRERFDFPEVARRFRLIEDDTVPVIAHRWKAVSRAMKRFSGRELLRELQPYVVSVYRGKLGELERRGLLQKTGGEVELWEWTGRYDFRLGVVEEVDVESFIV